MRQSEKEVLVTQGIFTLNRYSPKFDIDKDIRVQAFAADPEYVPFAKSRQAGTVSKLHVIDDTDVAGTMSYLKKP